MGNLSLLPGRFWLMGRRLCFALLALLTLAALSWRALAMLQING